MVKSTESTSVFDTKSAKERSDYVKDNQEKEIGKVQFDGEQLTL